MIKEKTRSNTITNKKSELVIFKLKQTFNLNKNINSLIKILGVAENCRITSLNIHQKNKINQYVNTLKTKNTLKNSLNKTKKFLSEIKHYKSARFEKGLPVRGQRTHTNAKTAKLLNRK